MVPIPNLLVKSYHRLKPTSFSDRSIIRYELDKC